MDLNLESARTARKQFFAILLAQMAVAWAPILALSILLILGGAQNVSQIGINRFMNFYMNVRLEPNDGLAGLAVIAAVVLALSLDSSISNYHQYRYSEFIYAYNIKKLLLVLSGIIVNLIALFALIDLALDLFTLASGTNQDVNFASILVLLSAIAVSILSAARVRHKEIEGINLGFQIKKEKENLNNVYLNSKRWRKWRIAPWQRFRLIHARNVLIGMVVVAIIMLIIIYAGTGVHWNPWQTIGITLLHIVLIFMAPLYVVMLLFYAIRSKLFMVLLTMVPLVLTFLSLSVFLVISGWQLETGYPAFDVLWALPAVMLFVGIVSIALPPRHRWPWWGIVFYPVNKMYYLIEQDFQQSRFKVLAISIAQLSKDLEEMRMVEG